MLRATTRHLVLLLVLFFGFNSSGIAQTKDQIERLWLNPEKSAKIQIYKANDGRYYGKIIWLKDPLRDGKPKVDYKNPDEKLRAQPIDGLVILKGFKKISEKEYDDGTVYDPNNGKTYSCIIKYEGDKLNVRGFIGFSWIGRTAIFTKID